MGVYQTVFIGPYAEFPVPPGQAERFPPEDEGGEQFCPETLACNWGLERRHTDAYRYVPLSTGAKRSARRMYFTDKGGAFIEDQDLTDVDRQTEMTWFAKTYGKELRELAKRYGSEPVIRWGVVCWFS